MFRAHALNNLIVAVAYIAASETAAQLLRISGDAPMVWFASGVGLVALLRLGPSAAIGIFAGALVCAFIGGKSPLSALGASFLTTAQIALAWWLLSRVCRISAGLEHIRDILALTLVGATVPPLMNVARALAYNWWRPELVTSERITLIQVTALGEAIGILLLVPTALAWFQSMQTEQGKHVSGEAWLIFALTLVIAGVVFSGVLAPAMSAPTLPYALFPLTFWAALRLGLRETATVLFIPSVIAVACHFMGMGPFVMPSDSSERTFAQFGSLYLFLVVLSVTSLLAAAAQREREGAESKVRDSEQRYRMLIERMNEGVNITDAKACMTFVSDRFCEMTGYTREELIGQTGAYLAVPEQFEAWRESHAKRRAGKSESHALTLRRKDGELLHVWVSPSPQFDPKGNYLGSLNVVLDITDRRRAEDRARDHLDQLAHVARVASMGEMASAIAHEINQPLTAIANYANASLRLLKAGKISQDEIQSTMQRLATEAERAGAVVRKMRGFVRAEEARPVALGIDELFADVRRLTSAEAHLYDVEIVANAAGDLPPLLADTIQIEQVLLNLVRNACEAIATCDAQVRRVTLSARATVDRMTEITVSDTGPGLSAQAVEKVFEAFYTTKSEGMGIGLALSRSIVDQHGGRLWAEASDAGGVFRLTLPIAEEMHDA
jgi:PAS domain S-box-containing protein